MSEEKQIIRNFFERPRSRREFLEIGGKCALGAASISIFSLVMGCSSTTTGEPGRYTVILQGAQGVVMADPTRCTGCRRCETVCTTYNDGKAQPYISRVKVGRNYNFGVRGATLGFWRGEGEFGNFRILPETCKQCKHPVPCATACPNQAIEADPTTGARIINEERCVGCGICASACPWAMITVDADKNKATKCFLCNGDPACVANCPTAALKFVSWRDLSKDTPIRNFGSVTPIGKAFQENCGSCHTSS